MVQGMFDQIGAGLISKAIALTEEEEPRTLQKAAVLLILVLFIAADSMNKKFMLRSSPTAIYWMQKPSTMVPATCSTPSDDWFTCLNLSFDEVGRDPLVAPRSWLCVMDSITLAKMGMRMHRSMVLTALKRKLTSQVYAEAS